RDLRVADAGRVAGDVLGFGRDTAARVGEDKFVGFDTLEKCFVAAYLAWQITRSSCVSTASTRPGSAGLPVGACATTAEAAAVSINNKL
ncbi:MAG: hypothetical protein ABJA02_02120, partial [Acidobacteriota bacterium]